MPHNPLQADKNPASFRLPPQSLEAEESLLSAILIDNETLFEVVEILIPEDFYKSDQSYEDRQSGKWAAVVNDCNKVVFSTDWIELTSY